MIFHSLASRTRSVQLRDATLMHWREGRREGEREKSEKPQLFGFANALPCVTRQQNFTSLRVIFEYVSWAPGLTRRGIACQPRWLQTISQRHNSRSNGPRAITSRNVEMRR